VERHVQLRRPGARQGHGVAHGATSRGRQVLVERLRCGGRGEGARAMPVQGKLGMNRTVYSCDTDSGMG
jgi:hypothetical protein